MLKVHEILGTDKPIFDEKEDNHFYFRELQELGEKPIDYKIVGYVKMSKKKEGFYQAVYASKKLTR